jgi:hypothetical protein
LRFKLEYFTDFEHILENNYGKEPGVQVSGSDIYKKSHRNVCLDAQNGDHPSPQLTAKLLVDWHLAASWPLCGATEEKIMKNEPLVGQKKQKNK